jgi:protein-O-mannosyltransferase-like protein/dolichyl-phosphate-mannose-protein mannosyltransferase
VRGPAAGEPDPGTGAPARTTTTRDAASAILVVLVLGLAFRLIIAQQLPGSGFSVDLNAFRFWADNLAKHGPFGFYDRDFFHDYTPGYLYVLWLVGLVGQVLGPLRSAVDLPTILGDDLIKVPAILADLGIGWLVWSMVQELGGSRRAALIGALIFIANPISWFDSVAWGQVDSVGTLVLLLAIRELWRDRPERSAILTVVAAVVKPQFGILIPIVAAVVIRRALFPAGAYGDDAPPGSPDGPTEGRTTLRAEREVRGPVRIITTGIAGLVTAIALSAPFGLSIVGLLEQVGTAAGGYPYLSVNAYNPWALLQLDGNGIAANGTWVCDIAAARGASGGACVAAFSFGPIPAVIVGTILLLVAVTAISLIVAARPDRRTILVGAAVLALAFFVLPTRVHERYLYPFYAIAAILAAVSFRWRLAYAALAAATLANMYVVLTTLYPENPSVEDWFGIGPAIRSATGVTIIAIVHLVGFVWAVAQLRRSAFDRLGDEIDATHPDWAEDWAEEYPAGTPERPAGVVAPRAMAGLDARPSRAPPLPAAAAQLGGNGAATWTERPSFGQLGAWAWLRSRLAERPVRPDRSVTLEREPGGRLDRLDAWFVVVLILAVLTLRVWRLAEPYRMHFDEVYHARTATEFLQDWRYGISHDIYEWTHPHLAKYVMAAGIVAWGDDRVTATSQLGVPVRDAVVEPRRDDTIDGAARNGDRLHVATGSEVRSYDLDTRRLESSVALPRATTLAIDATGQRLFVGTEGGDVVSLDTASLDEARASGPTANATVTNVAHLEAPIRHLHVASDGSAVLAATADDALVTLNPDSGAELGRVSLSGIAAIADAGTAPALVARPSDIPDVAAAASTLADLLGGSADDYGKRLTAQTNRVIVAPVPESGDVRTAVDTAITDQRLVGLAVESVPRLAVADSNGVTLVSPADGSVIQSLRLDGGAQGLALVNGVDDPKLYVTTRPPAGPRVAIVTVGGPNAKDAATLGTTFALPGAGSWVGYDAASQQVHVLGLPPAGRDGAEKSTVYVIEPHANAVYADAPLPYAPAAVALDTNELFQSSDRQQLLALGADGTTSSVDVGQHAFAWRLAGVVAGALMAALLYVLTRILFRRRSVAAIVGLLTLADGMFFVQSRIAMNDSYVGLFIVAAYVVFAAIWTNAWRWRGAFWVAMPAIGLLLGLALASKWVAAYAIGALGVLILARSAVGRVVLIAGMIVATTVLGYLAISVPAGQSGGNLTFMLIMIGLTVVTVLVTVLHPIAWSSDEARFAVAGPGAAGIGVLLVALALGKLNAEIEVASVSVTPLHAAFALIAVALLVAGAFWLAGRSGFGPFAPRPAPDDPVQLLEPPAPPAEGWLRPGWAFGLPIAWTLISMLAIPVAVYVVSYLPWAFIENHRITDSWPPGHTGQTLLELTGQMYNYHNTLSAAHAASSPWWAWPFDLKPVWFYQQSFAAGTAGAIYDAGNLVIWWLGVPAIAFCAWHAFRRRSLGLGLVAIAFACQWIAWARIDRAAFQYHYYTSLPFVVMALAYLIAEVWHGASARTWLLMKVAAAAAILAPVAMWLLHRPLCGFVRVTAVNPGSQACPTVIPDFVLTARALAIAVVVGLALVIIVVQFVRLDRSRLDSPEGARQLYPLIGSAIGAVLALLLASWAFSDISIINLDSIPVEPIALIVAIPLGALALVVATARDARRFAAGVLVAVVAEFVVFYPNLSALPLPAAFATTYQGVLPTYVYPFQFPVSTVDRHGPGPSLFAVGPAVLLGALTVTCLILAYSAWIWRVTLAERRLAEADDEGDIGTAYAGGGGR